MTFYYYSLGCKVNSYESSAIASLLTKVGFSYDENNPDIVIINTCAVTSTASSKSRQHIRKFALKWPNAILVVMGCAAQEDANRILKECRVDILIGTASRDKLLDYIKDYLKDKKTIIDINDKPRTFKYEELGITSCSENIRAYLKIQDGCNNFCSYCLIPYVRGASRSRASKEVINEAKNLLSLGYQEIVISGINIGSYGLDNNDISFSSLIEQLLNLDNLKRLRISSLEASQIDDKLIELLKNNPKLVSHLHIPLQSGSPKILKAMHRKYDNEEYLKKINMVKKARKDIALTTDVIVGFPGETEQDYLDTISFIKRCGFNMLHVFPYSSRKGTSASLLKNQISPEIKKDRVKRLLELSNKLWDEFTDRFTDQEIELLIEEYDDKKHLFYGHTGNYIHFYVASKDNLIGKFVKVKYKKVR